MGKFFLLFTIVPLIELYLLLYLGRVLGFWATVAIVLTTGFAGAALAKSQGARVLASWRESLATGTMPAEGVLGGLLVLVGGVLLVAPGVLTDLAGLSLLIPASRAFWARQLQKWFERRVERGEINVVTMGSVSMGGMGPRAAGPRAPARRPGPGGVIDVEGHEVEGPAAARPPARELPPREDG